MEKKIYNTMELFDHDGRLFQAVDNEHVKVRVEGEFLRVQIVEVMLLFTIANALRQWKMIE